METISIVTDSTSDIPEALAQTYDIQVIRNLIVMEGKSLEDGKDITREEYYRRLPDLDPPPTTATASSGIYQQTYEALFRRGVKHILSIHPPSSLSGIINAASSAAQAFGDRVHIIDSGQVSLGTGFQILAAAEHIRQGASLDRVIQLLENVRGRVRIVAMLDSLEYIRRSGRVSWARARIGNFLQIKPFVELKDGIVSSMGESRTRSKGIRRLVELLHQMGSLERLALLHSNAESDAHNLLDELQLDLAHPPLIVNVTTVIGTHVGPNGIGFAVVAH